MLGAIRGAEPWGVRPSCAGCPKWRPRAGAVGDALPLPPPLPARRLVLSWWQTKLFLSLQSSDCPLCGSELLCVPVDPEVATRGSCDGWVCGTEQWGKSLFF